MPGPRAFSAPIQTGDGGAAFVVVPFDVEAHFGRKRVPVRATFDGAPYRGSFMRRGQSEHLLLVRKDVREQIGKGPGDVVAVTVEEDTEERTVAVPDDLRAALRAGGVSDAFDALAFTHRREYVQWVEEAKRAATRERRIAQTVERLA